MTPSITILEIFAVVFPLVLVAIAFYRGAMYEFMQMIAWIAAIGVGEAVLPYSRPLVKTVVPGSLLGYFVAVTIVALPIAVVVSLFSRAITNEVNSSKLGLFNRGIGAAFGLVRGAVIVWLAVGMMSWSFFRSAAEAYDALDRGARSAKLEMIVVDMPLSDILCNRLDPPSPTLVRRLKSAEKSMSPIIHEIWLYAHSPEDFHVLNTLRTVSVSICAK